MLLTRRDLVGSLCTLPLTGPLSALMGLDRAEASAISAEARRAMEARGAWATALWMRRRSGEEVFADFRTPDGAWLPQGLATLSWFMRDARDGEAVAISPLLIETLSRVQVALSLVHGAAIPLILTSGYRSAVSNAATEGAARNSMHLHGFAADLVVTGYSPSAVAAAAATVGVGGIGLYPGFTHLDVWKARIWEGKARG